MAISHRLLRAAQTIIHWLHYSTIKCHTILNHAPITPSKKSTKKCPLPFTRTQPCSWEKVWRNLPLYPMSSHPIPSNVIPELKTSLRASSHQAFSPRLLNWPHFSFSHVARFYLTFYATAAAQTMFLGPKYILVSDPWLDLQSTMQNGDPFIWICIFILICICIFICFCLDPWLGL